MWRSQHFLLFFIAATAFNVQFKTLDQSVCSFAGIDLETRNNDPCLSMHIDEIRFHNKFFPEFLLAIEKTNSSVRQAKITFHSLPSLSELSSIGEHMDQFLTQNLWWSVLVEPFPWHETQRKDGIILERYNAAYEPYLRLLSATQYPDRNTCNKVPLLVNRGSMVHPGWSSVIEFYYMVHANLHYFPSVNYVSRSNRPADPIERTAFISAHECNTTNNKWDCAFLPLTTCTIPDVLTKCSETDCVSKYPDSFAGALLLSVANASGMVVPEKLATEVYQRAYNDHSAYRPYNNLQLKWSQHPNVDPPGYINLPIYNKTFPETSPGIPDSKMITYWFRLILRSNYRFRSLITKLIHDFYRKNHVNHNTRCVTAQVRRGDRVIKGVDMIEFCKNATAPITADHPINYCRDASGGLQQCDAGLGLDKGCESPVPFGAVTLDMVVKSAEQLVSPEVRTIFVFTDDELWLNIERSRVQSKYPNWKIVNLEAPKNTAPEGSSYWDKFNKVNYAPGYHYMRSEGGSKSGSYFLASLQLAQQCEAFVGHFSSAVTGLFHASMCYKSRNGLNQAVCPPVYDLRTGIIK